MDYIVVYGIYKQNHLNGLYKRYDKNNIESRGENEKKNKTNTSSMYLYDVIIIVAFATNSNGKKYRIIQKHISGSGNS